MTTCELLRQMKQAGVTLYLADNGRLRLRGPKAALTKYLCATLTEYMPEIVQMFNERAAIVAPDNDMIEREAEAPTGTLLNGRTA